MILEVAILNVRGGLEREFQAAFAEASPIIASMPGYISHQLQRCIETSNQYVLLVDWTSLEAHTLGSADHLSINAGSNCCIISTILSRVSNTTSSSRKARPSRMVTAPANLVLSASMVR